MTRLIIDIEAGAEACGQCEAGRDSIEDGTFYCSAFREELSRDKWVGFRLPACLAAESRLTALVEVVEEVELSECDCIQDFCIHDRARQALAALKEGEKQ